MEIRTTRGIYKIGSAAPNEHRDGHWIITVSLNHVDGLERFAFRCAVTDELVAARGGGDITPADLADWIAASFETLRESALRSLRMEHRVWQVSFDTVNPGPLTPSANG